MKYRIIVGEGDLLLDHGKKVLDFSVALLKNSDA